MKVEQVYALMNTITTELLGSSDLVKEDLSNVVDIGNQIMNASSVDAYVRSLVNHIGKVVFVDRVYKASVPSVVMDAWEYGSITQKIEADIPAATENESWELTNAESYDPNIFYKPSISVKFFNDKVTFEIPLSFTELQVKQSFSNAAQLNGFLSMLRNSVDKSLTLKMDSLIMRTINTMTAQTLNDEMHDADYSEGGVKAINLLAGYNEAITTPLLAQDCLLDADFIRYASYRIGIASDRLSRMSTLFNVGKKAKFTPKEMQRLVLLADFKRASDVYLQSDVYHNEKTELPSADVVPYWQASGSDYSIDSVGSIKVTIRNPNYDSDEEDTSDPAYGKTKDIESPVILGVLFDKDALGVSNLDRRTTTNYNPKAEFYNTWHKFDAGYFADLNENFVVFYVEDAKTDNGDNGAP